MALTKLQEKQLHYRAWRKLKDTLIADFNKRMRESNECVTELGVLNTMQNLEEIVTELNYASDNMKYLASEVQRIKQKLEWENKEMALTDKEQAHQHYRAWINFQNMLISDFNKVLRHEAGNSVETEERVIYIATNLNKIRDELALANDHLTFFEERIQLLNKQEEGK